MNLLAVNQCTGPHFQFLLRFFLFNLFSTEHSGYWETTSFLAEVGDKPSEKNPVVFYDSNTGKQLYKAPIGRTWDQFLTER